MRIGSTPPDRGLHCLQSTSGTAGPDHPMGTSSNGIGLPVPVSGDVPHVPSRIVLAVLR